MSRVIRNGLNSFFWFSVVVSYISTVALSLGPEQYNLYGAAPIYIEFILYVFIQYFSFISLFYSTVAQPTSLLFFIFLIFCATQRCSNRIWPSSTSETLFARLVGSLRSPVCALLQSLFFVRSAEMRSHFDENSKTTRPTLCRLELLTAKISATIIPARQMASDDGQPAKHEHVRK